MAVSIGEIEATLRLKDQLTPALKIAAGEMEKAGASIKRFGNEMASVGSTLSLVITAPLLLAAGAAVKFSKDYETAMVKVETLSGISADRVGEMRKEVLALAPAVGVGPQELAEALLVITSTGLRGAEAMDILNSSARASAAGLGETKDVARVLTSAMTAYGKENLSAAEAADKLFVAVREGGAEASEFAGSLGRVIGISAQVGVSFDEIVTSVATFTRLGVDADEAVTALRGSMTVLLHPTKQAREELTALGTSIEEVRKHVKENGLAAALIELVRLTNGNDDAIGQIIPNVRALSGVLGTAGRQAGAYGDILKLVQTASGDLDKAFSRMTQTLGFQWNQLKAATETLAIQLGDRLAPSFKVLIGLAADFVKFGAVLLDWFTALPRPLQMAALAAAALGVALGPVLYTIGNLVAAFGGSLALIGMVAKGWLYLTGAVSAHTVATAANVSTQAASAVATATTTAAVAAEAGALQLAAAEQLSFNIMAAEGTQLMLPLSGTIAAAGAAATTASVGFGAMAASISVIGGLLVGLGFALKQTLDGVANLAGAFKRGNFWETLTAKDDDTFLRRWLGFSKGAKDAASALNESEAAAKFAKEEFARLKDQLSGAIDSKNVKQLATAVRDLSEAGALSAPAMRRVAVEAEALQKAGQTLPPELANIVTWFERTKESGIGAGNGVEDLTDQIKDLFKELGGKATSDLTALSAAWAKLTPVQQRNKATVEALVEAYDKVRGFLRKDQLPAAFEELRDQVRTQDSVMVHTDQVFGKFVITLDQMKNFAKGLTHDGLLPLATGFDTASLSALALDKHLARLKTSRDALAGQLAGVIQLPDVKPSEDGKAALREVRMGFLDNLSQDLAHGLGPAVISAFQGGGSVGRTLGAFVGDKIGENLGATLARSIGGTFGEMAGSFLPGIGAVLGGIAGKLIEKLHKPEWKKFANDVGRDWGVSISDGLAQQLEKDSLKFGRQAAALLNLDKIIGEAGGAKSFGLDKAFKGLNDLVSMLEAGKLSAGQVGDEFDKVFSQVLPESITKGTSLATKQLLGLIDTAHRFGVESKAIADFYAKMGQQVATGFNAVVQGVVGPMVNAVQTMIDSGDKLVTLNEQAAKIQASIDDMMAKGGPANEKQRVQLETWTRQLADLQTQITFTTRAQREAQKAFEEGGKSGQDAFSRMGRLAEVAFGAAIAGGQSFLQAITAIGPALDTLTLAQQKFGFTSSGAFDELLKFRQFAEVNKDLLGELDGLNQMMSGLNNLGLLTQQTFDDIGTTAGEAFQKMVDGGLTGDQALRLMQPTLQTIWQLQQEFGFTVDENTQKMIDQAIEAGIVGEKHKDAAHQMVDAMKSVEDILTAIAIKLGADLPKAAAAGAKGVKDAVDGIPKNVDVNVSYHGNGVPDLPDFPHGAPEFASGSGGLQNFGAGTLAMLHGHEGVYTADQIAALVGNSVSAGSGAGGGSDAVVDEIAQLRLDMSRMVATMQKTQARLTRDAVQKTARR